MDDTLDELLCYKHTLVVFLPFESSSGCVMTSMNDLFFLPLCGLLFMYLVFDCIIVLSDSHVFVPPRQEQFPFRKRSACHAGGEFADLIGHH